MSKTIGNLAPIARMRRNSSRLFNPGHLKIQNGGIEHGEIAMKDRERTIIQNDRVTVFTQNLSTDSRTDSLVVYAQNARSDNLHMQTMDRRLLKATY